MQTTTPIRISRETRRQLRHIAAETNETIQAIIARLVAAELALLDAARRKEAAQKERDNGG